MFLRKWEDMPEFMKNEEVKKYFDILNKKRGNLILKRLMDIIMSLILIILMSPILIFVSIWIKIDSRGPIFYKQIRITNYGESFKIYKFRTMVNDADRLGALVTTKNDPRITHVGEKIRRCRLDEIPQLFNVLLGEMSFVGTRPEVKKYVVEYTDEMKATLLLPAGVTSLASINFKNEDEILSKYLKDEISIDEIYLRNILPEKMKFNLNYIVRFSLIKDILICIKTVF